MDLGLHGKVILVTGGAKGIGAGIARVLANEDAIPVVLGHNAQHNDIAVQSIRECGRQAHGILAESTDTRDCQRAVEEVVVRFGQIDGLVNNAGVNDRVSLQAGDTDAFLLSLRRNLVHYFDMARFALPELKKSRGAIVNIGSKVAETGQGATSG